MSASDDVFQHALLQIHQEAPPELVKSFLEKMRFIRTHYPHSETTIESCLDGLSEPPTLLELLVAAFVVNGGLLFKHGPELVDDPDEEETFRGFMQEIERLGLSTEDPVKNKEEAGSPPPPETQSP